MTLVKRVACSELVLPPSQEFLPSSSLRRFFLKSSNPPLFPFPGKPPRKLLLRPGLGDEQPRDEPGAPRKGEQEDRRLPQLARQLHRQPIAWACGIIVIVIMDRHYHQGYLNLPNARTPSCMSLEKTCPILRNLFKFLGWQLFSFFLTIGNHNHSRHSFT